MFPSILRQAGVAAIALALAACAGNATVPSGIGSASGNVAAMQDKKSTPCSTLANTWDFLGACKSAALKPSGGAVELQRYQGIAVSMAFRKTDATSHVPFLFGDATGNGDVTGTLNSASFPLYGTNCVDGTSQSVPCTGTAFVYIEAVNTTQTAVNLTASPRIDVTNQHPYPGKACSLAVLQSSGAWMLTSIGANAKKHALEIPSAAAPLSLPPGGFYFTIACQ